MTFPVGIYKAMRSVTEGIHHISLANNELKSLTGRFVTTFNQLRGKGQPHCFTTSETQQRAPRLLQRGHSITAAAPLNSHLTLSTNSGLQKASFIYPCRRRVLTHPPKLVLWHFAAPFSSRWATARSLTTLLLPPRMGLGMKKDRKGSLGIMVHGRARACWLAAG